MIVASFKAKIGYDDAVFMQKLRPISCDGLLTPEQVEDTFFEIAGLPIPSENMEEARQYFRDHLLRGLAATLEQHGLIVGDL